MGWIDEPVLPVLRRWNCAACYNGEMKPDGICLSTQPPRYPHTCETCGHRETSNNGIYPRIVYIDKEGNEI